VRKSQVSTDTIAKALQAEKLLGYVVGSLKKAQLGQAIADINWARICIENAVREIKKAREE
jgi:hypothetical protein